MTLPPTKDILLFSGIAIAAIVALKLASGISSAANTVASNVDPTAVAINATDDATAAGVTLGGAALGAIAALLLL